LAGRVSETGSNNKRLYEEQTRQTCRHVTDQGWCDRPRAIEPIASGSS
jgi:hypothetical protein